jgi:hypothetical protein
MRNTQTCDIRVGMKVENIPHFQTNAIRGEVLEVRKCLLWDDDFIVTVREEGKPSWSQGVHRFASDLREIR